MSVLEGFLFAALCEGLANIIPQFPVLLTEIHFLMSLNGRNDIYVFLYQRGNVVSENPLRLCLMVRNK